MNKKEHAKILFETLTDVDDAFVSEAQREPVRKEQKHSIPLFSGMRFAAAAFACAVVAFVMFNLVQPDHTDPNNNVQVVNPVTEVETMDEAESMTGFAMEYDSFSDDYNNVIIRVYERNMIEVSFNNADMSEEGYYIRKSTDTEDISGDYSDYEVTETETINGMEVMLKGDGEVWSVATWENDGYTYAVGCQSHPMSFDLLSSLIETIK